MKKSSLPSDKVFVRLAPSKLHGIGVVAIRDIKKGAEVFKGDNTKMVWIEESRIQKLPAEIRKLYENFGVYKNGRIGVPKNFNQLTPAWYVNHSKTPNLRCNKSYDFVAERNIKSGEELTIDYSTYSE